MIRPFFSSPFNPLIYPGFTGAVFWKVLEKQEMLLLHLIETENKIGQPRQ